MSGLQDAGVREDASSVVVRTVEGVRVAVAGLRDAMPVDVEGLVCDVMSVGDLRALQRLPQPVRIRITYRLLPDNRVHLSTSE